MDVVDAIKLGLGQNGAVIGTPDVMRRVTVVDYWIDSNAWNPRFLAAMMSSGSARQMNFLASVSLCSAMNRLIAAWRSTSEWNTPCFRRRRDSLAKKPSTAFNQELDVGVKWEVQRG